MCADIGGGGGERGGGRGRRNELSSVSTVGGTSCGAATCCSLEKIPLAGCSGTLGNAGNAKGESVSLSTSTSLHSFLLSFIPADLLSLSSSSLSAVVVSPPSHPSPHFLSHLNQSAATWPILSQATPPHATHLKSSFSYVLLHFQSGLSTQQVSRLSYSLHKNL